MREDSSLKSRFPVEHVALALALDFTSQTNSGAIARIRQLAAQGLSDGTIADLFGWNRSDVRRAITPAPSRRSHDFERLP
jgi:hypothetical protein